MNALERFGDDRAHAEQAGALGRPVARRARAVFLSAQHDQRNVLLRVVLRGVVDERLLTVFGEVAGVTAGHVIEQLVAQADVGERAADHHLVVAAPRAVGVVVLLVHAVLVEVLRGRRTRLDAARGGDVVGGHRIAQQCQHSGALDVGRRPPARRACRRSTAACAHTSSRRPTRRCCHSASAGCATARRP